MFFLISLVLLVLGEYILHIESLSNEGPLYHVGQEFTSARMTRREKLNCIFTAIFVMINWKYVAQLSEVTPGNGTDVGPDVARSAASNLGLAVIIRIVSRLTLLLYPITITLVAATILDVVAPGRLRTAYTWPVAVAGVLGLVSALAEAGWDAPSALLARSGAWNGSTGWIAPTLLALVLGAALEFEPAIRCRIHDFESYAFNHSATSPCTDNYTPLYLFLLIM